MFFNLQEPRLGLRCVITSGIIVVLISLLASRLNVNQDFVRTPINKYFLQLVISRGHWSKWLSCNKQTCFTAEWSSVCMCKTFVRMYAKSVCVCIPLRFYCLSRCYCLLCNVGRHERLYTVMSSRSFDVSSNSTAAGDVSTSSTQVFAL